MTDSELLKQALDALEDYEPDEANKVCEAIRARLTNLAPTICAIRLPLIVSTSDNRVLIDKTVTVCTGDTLNVLLEDHPPLGTPKLKLVSQKGE